MGITPLDMEDTSRQKVRARRPTEATASTRVASGMTHGISGQTCELEKGPKIIRGLQRASSGM